MTPAPHTPRQSRRLPRVLLALLACCAVAGVLVYRRDVAAAWHRLHASGAADSREKDKLYRVKRGAFNVTVLVDGTLNAIKRHDLKAGTKGRFELVVSKVIEDKSKVKKGQVIISFDREKADEMLEKYKLDLENIERDFALAREDLDMTRSENRSSLKKAYDTLRSANEALQKYKDLEAPRDRRKLQNGINGAEDQLRAAEAKLSVARGNLASLESMDEDKVKELEGKVKEAQKNLDKARQALDDANRAFRVFRQYDYPQKMRTLQEAAVQARLNLRKAFVSAKGSIIQGERRIQNYNKQIESKREQIKSLVEDIAKLEIKAPVDGIVTLGNPRRRHWQQPKDIEVGTKVHGQELIASIPDLSKFVVAAQIPEEYRSRVHVGQEAKLRSPAFPDLLMEGKLTYLAPMARHVVRWDQSSPKVYDAKINTDTTDKRLMPGMTVKVEIVVETVKDVLFVPVEAAYNREGKIYCRVQHMTGPEEREIETGRSSIHYVEITRGLEPGQSVLLQRELGEK